MGRGAETSHVADPLRSATAASRPYVHVQIVLATCRRCRNVWLSDVYRSLNETLQTTFSGILRNISGNWQLPITD